MLSGTRSAIHCTYLVLLLAVVTTIPLLPAPLLAQLLSAPELPRVFLDTTYTPPTGGTIITVNAGGDLQAALNQAQPGDIIELQAGATFTGNFTLPNKTGTGWIYIRSSAHASLPPPGTRVTPAHANLMPKIVSPNTSPAISTASGAPYYRFVGIEITTTGAIFDLISLQAPGQTSLSEVPTDIVFDRCYIHGTPTANARRGIAMNSAWTAVIDSYLSDFHEVGADSQAIAGWNGPGPFKLVNNYLEGAGENVMFGGADPSITNLVPSDIEIRGNHFFKPLSWKGGPWVVKNIFELKNAQRVLVEGNIFENNWVAAQGGWAILFTVRNQDGSAPWSVVQDVTFVKNIVRHSANGINIHSTDNLYLSQQTRRILIQDNVFDDINSVTWGGNGRLFQLLNQSGVGIADLTIEHNTGFEDLSIAYTGDNLGAPHTGFIFRNNIFPTRLYGFLGGGTGDGNTTLNTYYASPVFINNVMAGGTPLSYSDYPGNFFPATDTDVGFVDLAGGDYHLSVSSPYMNAGTDGKDIGADIDALNAATACALSGACGSPLPTVSMTAPISGSTVSGTVTVSASASDNVGVVGVQFKLDGINLGVEDTAAPYAISWDTTTAANGSHTLTAVARDAAGNIATSSGVSVTVSNGDTTPPVIAGVAASVITSSGAIITWTTNEASDSQVEHGLTTAYGSVTPLNTSLVTAHAQTLSGLAANTVYHYRVKSRDAAGNLATSGDLTFTTLPESDTTPPTVSMTAPISGSTVSGTVTVSASASDNVGVVGVQFKLDGINLGAEDTTNPHSISWDTTTVANGSHTLTAVARDAAGNASTSMVVTVTVNNDTTPPVLSAVTASSITSSGATITWTTNEASDSQVEYGLTTAYGSVTPLNTSLVTAHAQTLSGLAANTVYHYRVKSRDAAGNLAVSGDFTFTTAASGAPVENVIWTHLVNVTATGNSLQKTEGCDGCQDAGAASVQTITTGDGYMEFTASETTTSRIIGLSNGNTDTSIADIDFGLRLWPGGGLSVLENGVYRTETTYTTGDVLRVSVVNNQVKYSKNGVIFYTSTLTPTYPLLVDSALLSITATLNGVVIARATSPSADATAPTVSITAPTSGSTVAGTVVVSASASDNVGVVGVQFKLDGINLGAEDTTNPHSISWDTTTVANGSHTLTAVARDAAGNLTTSAAVTVTVANNSLPPTAGTRSPYKGVPFPVPGLIEAEDFDNGGEGVAYHDLTLGNQGGLYRTDVDVDIISPYLNGHVLNNFQTGEWLEYTINVAATGTYWIEALVSSEFTTSRWHIEIDGVNVTGSILVPNTGWWGTFQWVGKRGVPLTVGQHNLRIYTEQEYFNLDAIRIAAEGPQPVVWTHLVNVTATGNSLQKTEGCDGCQDAGAASVQTITTGDGYMEFTASETTTSRIIGLSNGNTDTSIADIDFGLRLWPGGGLSVLENGVYRTETTYTTGDVLRVSVVNNQVKYSKNGVIFYTSTLTPTYPLLVDTSILSLYGTITNAVISGVQ